MYSKLVFLALLSLSLTVGAAPNGRKSNTQAAAPTTCATGASTTKTVTVTASALPTAVPNASRPPRGPQRGPPRGPNGNPPKAPQNPANPPANPANPPANPPNNVPANPNAGQPPRGGNNASQGNGATGDPNTSLCLVQNAVMTLVDGQAQAGAGQEASAVSVNNFINFCAGKTLTNGKQIQAGSCNGIPMGDLPAKERMTAAKFQFPANFATVQANQDFTFQVQVQNIETGHFTNPDVTFFGAPQTLNRQGILLGHSHITCQKMSSLTSTQILPTADFAFFKGLNDPAQGGILSATVTGGLPAAAYRCCTINSASNHQAVAMPVAQRGSTDDCVFFEVSANANQQQGNQNGQQNDNQQNGAQNGQQNQQNNQNQNGQQQNGAQNGQQNQQNNQNQNGAQTGQQNQQNNQNGRNGRNGRQRQGRSRML